MFVCPYCQQDDLWVVHLNTLGRDAILCYECETVWLLPCNVEYGKGHNFENFMKEHNQKADWSLIVKIQKFIGNTGKHI
jgi:hypothetical protein